MNSPFIPNWVTVLGQVARDWKLGLSHYAATHLISYGDVIQLGSGTTLNKLMDEIIERQQEDRKPLDLMILTTNLHVLERGREAQEKFQNIFSSMQMILTGGSLQLSLHSLAGEFAATGVRTDVIYPKVVFFGAAGLSFDGGELTITYQFQDELSTQISYATRPTEHRVLLCDHTKLGKRSAWKANISVASMLAQAERCTIVSTLPEEPSPAIERQLAGFDRILDEAAHDPKFREKDLAFLLVNRQGAVQRELSLAEKRKSRARRNGESVESGIHRKRGPRQRAAVAARQH